MAKTDFKAVMLARGEKFLLIGAIAIAALLLLWGLIAAVTKPDPTAGTSELTRGANDLRRKLDSPNAPVTLPKRPLPEYTPVMAKEFAAVSTPFEPTVWPDKFRQPPRALPPIDSQIDLFLVSVRKHARDNFERDPETGEITNFMGQWITTQVDPKVDPRKLAQEMKDSLQQRPGRRPRQGGGQPGGGQPGGGQPPGVGGPGGGPRGGGEGGGSAGLGGGEEFGGGPGYGPGQLSKQKSSEQVVEWKKYSEVMESNKPAVPAYGVFPTRMAVVYLSYPLEDQLKEVQRALRLPSLRQAILETSPEKLFATDPDTGKVVPYSTLATGGAGGTGPGVGGGPGMPPGVGPGGPTAGSPMMGGGGPPRGAGEGPSGSGGEAGATLTANTLAAPVFAGFVVQRRKTVNGETGAWEDFDHADRYFNEFTLYDAPVKPDTGYLPYFLRADQGLAAPMPQVAPNWTSTPQLAPGEAEPKEKHYPEYVRMPSIVSDFEALQKVLKPVKKKEALGQYKRNGLNPYGVGGSRTGVGGGLGIPGLSGGEDDGGAGVMGGGFGMPPRGPIAPNGTGAGTTGGTAEFNKSPLAVKHMLIRFLDTDLLPGVSYQYQVKVKLRNPNFNKKKDVADEKLAEVEYIESDFFQCRQTLKVPGESYLYAGNIKEYEKGVADLQEQVKKANNDRAGLIAPDRLNKLFETQAVKDGKRAVVQMQRWVSSASFGAEEERIGAWVQAEVPVAPGEYIGRRTLVELPLWKAALGKYLLTPTAKPLVTGWPKEVANQPAGRPVDFRTRHVLIDFEGGRVKAAVDDRPVSDEAATELLILRDDGKLEVRKELADAVLPERVARDKNWKEWIADVRKQSDLGGSGTNPGGFGSPRGDGGPGGPGGGAPTGGR